MDKRDRAALLAARLGKQIESRGLTLAEIARAASIDRTTLSQLLVGERGRVPNGHVLAELAQVLGVSTDWFLGLTDEPGGAPEILLASVQVARAARAPFDETVMSWFREAEGRKIRHVPAGMPDLLKTEATIRHEWQLSATKTSRQAVGNARDRLAYLNLPDADVEVALSRQTVETYARGGGIWTGLSADERRRQLQHMATLIDQHYPRLRLYLFDERRGWSAPFTVFGSIRAALYIGGVYFSFTGKTHIRALAERFDQQVREADMNSQQAPAWMESLETA